MRLPGWHSLDLIARQSADDVPVIDIDKVRDGTPPIILHSAFLILTWAVVGMRVWTRARIIKSFGSDDVVMIITLMFFTVYLFANIEDTAVVSNKDALTKSELSAAVNLLIVTQVFYIFTMIALKLSLGIFLLRVIMKPWQKRLIILSLFISTLYGISYFFIVIFQCGVNKNALEFSRKLNNGKCISRAENLGTAYTHAVIVTVTDMLFAFLPIDMVRKSKMSRKEKIIVSFILALGAIGGVASMVRIKFIPKLAQSGPKFFSNIRYLSVWSTIEPGLGIVAGSLATMRPLFRRFFHDALSIGSRTTANGKDEFPTHESNLPIVLRGPIGDVDDLSDFAFKSDWPYEKARFSATSPSSYAPDFDLESAMKRSSDGRTKALPPLPPLPDSQMTNASEQPVQFFEHPQDNSQEDDFKKKAKIRHSCPPEWTRKNARR